MVMTPSRSGVSCSISPAAPIGIVVVEGRGGTVGGAVVTVGGRVVVGGIVVAVFGAAEAGKTCPDDGDPWHGDTPAPCGRHDLATNVS